MNGLSDWVELVVSGNHMSGLSKNHELVDLGARLVGCCWTAPAYRFYAWGSDRTRPALVRQLPGAGGIAIEVELWRLPTAGLASWLRALRQPQAIGRIELDDGAWTLGFVVEQHALLAASDITSHGGWRDYLKRKGMDVGGEQLLSRVSRLVAG